MSVLSLAGLIHCHVIIFTQEDGLFGKNEIKVIEWCVVSIRICLLFDFYYAFVFVRWL